MQSIKGSVKNKWLYIILVKGRLNTETEPDLSYE